jgi:hypothetical protein
LSHDQREEGKRRIRQWLQQLAAERGSQLSKIRWETTAADFAADQETLSFRYDSRPVRVVFRWADLEDLPATPEVQNEVRARLVQTLDESGRDRRPIDTPGKVKQAFVVAPADLDLATLRTILSARGVATFASTDLPVLGTERSRAALNAALSADALIVVLTGRGSDDALALFVSGAAAAAAKPLLVLAPYGLKGVPEPLKTSAFDARIDNADSLELAVDRLVSTPPKKRARQTGDRKRKGASSIPHELTNAFTNWWAAGADAADAGVALESIVEGALRAAGASALSRSTSRDFGDFVVWVDEVNATLGNPILVEVKSRIAASDLDDFVTKFRDHLSARQAAAGLLVWGEGPPMRRTATPEGRVLMGSVEEMLLSLQQHSLGQYLEALAAGRRLSRLS